MPRRLFLRLLAAAAPAGDHVPDSELLRRFASAKDSASFELIVRRHADAVWAAGYRVLRNEADADDAFQATFLALARKAGSIRGACAGGWLHRVAVNAALKLKANRDRAAATPLHPLPDDRGSPDHTEQADLAAVIHQELAGLPDRYRLPVMLCDLEGNTHAEAARILGWPIGSVSGRLSRAHGILRDRLIRRGFAAPAVLLVAVTAPSTVVSAATSVASGAAVSPVVLSLTEGVLSAMRVAKLKLAAAVLAATGFASAAGVGTVYALTRVSAPAAPIAAGEQQPPPKAEKADPPSPDIGKELTAFPNLGVRDLDDLIAKCPRMFKDDLIAINPKDDTLTQLRKARLNAGLAELRVWGQVAGLGRMENYNIFLEVSTRVAAAAADLYTNPKELRPWLEERVRVAKWFEASTAMRVNTGNEPPQMLDRARYARLEAEIALVKLGQPAAGGGR